MANYYLGKIRFQKEDDRGSLKTHNEQYLIDAVSYTEAEARMFEIIEKFQKDFQLVNLSRMKVREVFMEEVGSECWFKAKVQYISFDEKTQKEKKTPYLMLINADNIKEAYDGLVNKLGKVNDYQITDINMTPILEVFPH